MADIIRRKYQESVYQNSEGRTIILKRLPNGDVAVIINNLHVILEHEDVSDFIFNLQQLSS